MKFSVEWKSRGRNANAEERATLCDLRIDVGNKNVSAFFDNDSREVFDVLILPAVHLAEGIASNWWLIFGGRDVVHRVLPWRTGYALPDISFECNGSTFAISCSQSECANPELQFLNGGMQLLQRREAENELGRFVDGVTRKLSDAGISESEVQLAWSRVEESRSNDDERAFCEAAGALGVDPYTISNADADFIESAGNLFRDEALVEFLAGIVATPGNTTSNRWQLVDWIAKLHPNHSNRLPYLRSIADQIRDVTLNNRHRPPWARGQSAARAFRNALDMNGTTAVSTGSIAKKLGGAKFRRKQGPREIFAVVARENHDIHVHLRERGKAKWAKSVETFAFARALGDAVCFSETPLSMINDLHKAERQAVGRAFAAEFVAPAETVLGMREEGRDIDEIAGLLDVNPTVVNHHIENARRRGDLAA